MWKCACNNIKYFCDIVNGQIFRKWNCECQNICYTIFKGFNICKNIINEKQSFCSYFIYNICYLKSSMYSNLNATLSTFKC